MVMIGDDDGDDGDDEYDASLTNVSYQQSHSITDLHSRAPILSLSSFIILAHGTNPASASMCGKIIIFIYVYIDVDIHYLSV